MPILKKFFLRLRCLGQDTRGATAVETTLILAVLFAIGIGFSTMFGDNLSDQYDDISGKMTKNK